MKWKKRFKKTVYVLFSILALLCLILVLLVFYPFKSDSLKTELEKAFTDATGEKVLIENASLYIAQGRCSLENLSFSDKYRIKEIRVTINPLRYIQNRKIEINNISVISPDPVKICVSGECAVLKTVSRIVDNLNKESQESSTTNLEIDTVRVQNASVLVTNDEESTESLASILKTNMEINLSDDFNRIKSTFKGDIKTGGFSPFRGFVQIDRKYKEVNYSFQFNNITQKFLKPFNFKNNIFLKDVYLSGKASYNGSNKEMINQINIGQFDYYDSKTGVTVSENNISTTETLKISSASEYSLSVAMKSSKVDLSAGINKTPEISAPDVYVVLKSSNCLPDVYKMIENEISRSGMKIDISQAGCNVDFRAMGSFISIDQVMDTLKIDAKIGFQNISIYEDTIRGWIEKANGELNITNEDILIKNLTGSFNGIGFMVAGKISGDRYFYNHDAVNLNWAAKFNIEDLIEQIQDRANYKLSGRIMSGTITGTGNVFQKISRTKKNQPLFETVKASGAFEIENGKIKHPFFPDEIYGINGNFVISNDKIFIDKMTGNFKDSTVALNGSIKGRKFFWIDSTANINVESEFTIADIINFTQDRSIKNQIRNIVKTGNVVTSFNLYGDLMDPENLNIAGKCEISDVTINPPGGYIKGNIENVNARISLSDEMLSIDNVHAEINEIPIVLRGRLFRDSIRIEADTALRLERLKEIYPEELFDLLIKGPVKIHSFVTINTKQKSFIDPPIEYDSSTYELFSRWADIITSGDNLSDIFEIKYSGEVVTNHTTISYADMPPLIDNVTGVFKFEGNRITFQNVRSDWGVSKNCLISGEVKGYKDGFDVGFELRTKDAYLKEWTEHWDTGSSTYIEDKGVNMTESKKEIRGRIIAENFHYEDIVGTNFDGKFQFNHYQTEPNVFYFYDCKSDAYDGKVVGQGVIRIPSGQGNYEVTTEGEGINIEKFLKGIRPNREAVTGILDYQFYAKGTGDDLDTMKGHGYFNLNKSRFIGSVLFKTIGKLLQMPIISDMTFTTVASQFKIDNGAIFFPELIFESSGLEMKTKGYVYFNQNIEFDVSIAVIKALLDDIPVVKELYTWGLYLGRYLLKFEIRGTIDDPKVNTVPLSMDKFKNVYEWIFDKKNFSRIKKIF